MKPLLAVFALSVLASCAAAQQQPDPNPVWRDLPPRTIMDTRFIVNIEIDSSVVMMAKRALMRDMPRESGLCLQGFLKSFDRYTMRRTLVIFEALEPAHVYNQTDTTIAFDCAATKYFIGTLHTHTHRVPEICKPSMLDEAVLINQDRIIIIYILCSDGAVYVQLKDGRWNWFRWNGAGEIKQGGVDRGNIKHKEHL